MDSSENIPIFVSKFNFFMKQSEIKVTIKLGDVLDAPLLGAWEQMCDKYDINEWCLNEGNANSDDTINVSLEDAIRWGLVKKNNHLK